MMLRLRESFIWGRRLLRRRLDAQVADDFDWCTYTEDYRRELSQMEDQFAVELRPDDYRFTGGSGGRLERDRAASPLHPNHRLLYETMLQLTPHSVVEAGCGAGYHLHNLQMLQPELVVSGLDRSREQLDLLQERSPGLRSKTRVVDLTLPLPRSLAPSDVAFTQAVLMHIKTGNNHLNALANLFSLASRQIVLMENWLNHPFLDDILRLHADHMLPWTSVHPYVRRSPELDGRPHLIVISRQPLDLEPLQDYSILTQPLQRGRLWR